MNTLRLGAHALPPGEVVLVQTLFRLYGQNKPFPWTFVTAPPYDALLVDGMATDRAAQAERMAKAVLRLTRTNAADAPGTLQRPIRPDRFQDWLRAIEADLLEPATAPPPASRVARSATRKRTSADCAAAVAAQSRNCRSSSVFPGFIGLGRDSVAKDSNFDLSVPLFWGCL